MGVNLETNRKTEEPRDGKAAGADAKPKYLWRRVCLGKEKGIKLGTRGKFVKRKGGKKRGCGGNISMFDPINTESQRR